MISPRPRLPQLKRVVLIAILLSLSCNFVQGRKKDRNAGHSHRGLLKKLLPGPFALDLSGKEEDCLSADKAVMKSIEDDSGQGGTAICGKFCLCTNCAKPVHIHNCTIYDDKGDILPVSSHCIVFIQSARCESPQKCSMESDSGSSKLRRKS